MNLAALFRRVGCLGHGRAGHTRWSNATVDTWLAEHAVLVREHPTGSHMSPSDPEVLRPYKPLIRLDDSGRSVQNTATSG